MSRAVKMEIRWAVEHQDCGLLGRFCWGSASEDEHRTKTFRTRKLGRAARGTCCYAKAKTRLVRVAVKTEIL